jgi:hypothetical protein
MDTAQENYVRGTVTGFFMELSAGCFLRGVLAFNKTAGDFQGDIPSPMAVLPDHNHLFLGGEWDHIYPG